MNNIKIFEYPFTSNFLKIGDLNYHYLDEGKGDIILMVHGNPSWSYLYRNLITSLKKTHRVIAVDHIGCGLSDKPQDYEYTVKNHINNLNTLLNELKIEKFNLIVHDWGGPIGVGATLENHKRLEKLVIFNTACFPSPNIPFSINLCKLPIFGKIAIRNFNAFAEAATKWAVNKPMSKEIKEGFILPYDSYNNRIATHEFVVDIPMSPKHSTWETIESIEKNLSKIKDVPKIVCWGKDDFCFNDSFLKMWKEKCPEATFHEFNAGHYLLEDAFDEIEPIVQNFLK